MKKTILYICILQLALLISCGAEQKSEKTIFSFNQNTPVSSLDPAFARNQTNIWATNQLYNGLVQLDDSLNIKPCIAKDWILSEDGKVFTFNLRTDVKFHENECFKGAARNVVASDVVYSFNRVLDDAVGSPGDWIFKGRVAEELPFEAVNDSTFVLRLQKPFLPFLGILTMQYAAIVPKEAVEFYKEKFRTNPVGTGPFELTKWVEGQVLLMRKNTAYFEVDKTGERLPYVDGLKMYQIKDKKSAYLEFNAGKLDMISGVESSFVDELLDKEGNLLSTLSDKVTFNKSPYLNVEYIGINQQMSKGKALGQVKVRQALNYAIDRPQMLKRLRNNVGVPANSGFTPKGLPSFDDKKVVGFSYDMEKARQLLIEAGFENGKGIEPITISTNKEYVDLVTYIRKQWAELGIEVEVDLVESATLREQMTQGKSQMFRASWIADYPDAESFMTCFYGENPSPPNYTQFKHPGFDTLYNRALVEVEEPYKSDVYNHMDRILVEEAPAIFLFYDEVAQFTKKNIYGISSNGANLLSVKYVQMRH